MPSRSSSPATPVRWLWLGLVLGVGLLLAALLLGGSAMPLVVHPAGILLQYDDFAFTATSAREVAPGKYQVGLRVENHAKRVSFTFDPGVVRVRAASGQPLALVSSPSASPLLAGQGQDYTLAFQGPPGLGALRVGFEFGGPLGTALDNLLTGKRAVEVPVRP